MTEKTYDVLGIGNAIVDVLAKIEDEFLAEQNLVKGSMTLVDAATATDLYGKIGNAIEASGGSAANTMAGIASLGGRSAFTGKVRDDQLGEIFRHDIRASGVAFDSAAAVDGPSTARCMVMVTPDAQRTMATYLGAAVDLRPNDIDADLVAASEVTYLEGYLWDAPPAKDAFLRAARIAHEAGNKVSLTLSDSFCVDRHRESFLELVRDHVDLLFANEAEITSLYQVEVFDDALQAVRGHCQVVVLTRSEKGAVVLSGEEVHVVDAAKVDNVVDTTGAGDLFASGFLHGYTQGKGLYDCARIGAAAAAAIIAHFGARPEVSLQKQLADTMT